MQRFLVHRAGELFAVYDPGEGIHRALVAARIGFQALLQQAHDRALARADRTVQQQHAPLGPIAVRGGLEELHQLHQRSIQAEHGISASTDRVVEEIVVDDLLPVLGVAVRAVREDHVVHALERGARHSGVSFEDLQVIREGAVPVELPVYLGALWCEQ